MERLTTEQITQAKAWFADRAKAFENQPELEQICNFYKTALEVLRANLNETDDRSCEHCFYEHSSSAEHPCNACKENYLLQFKSKCDKCHEYKDKAYCANCGRNMKG